MHELDIGKTRFREIVKISNETKPRLPFVHTTDSYTLGEIIDDKKIIPQGCNVFSGELLTYFFYGRPSFRPNIDAQPSSLKHHFPICIIFKDNLSATLKRIFPFDSGAFQGGFYEAFLHKKMRLGDFGLEPDPSTPGRIVSRFFGSNEAYMAGKPTSQSIDPSEFEIQSYMALISSQDANSFDNRSSAIEIQTEKILEIEDSISAIILPSAFADGRIGASIRSMNIDALPYRTFEKSRPNEYTSKIAEMCLDYYIRLKLIQDQ